MAKKLLQKKLKSYLTPQNILISIFGLISLIIVIVLLLRSSDLGKPPISEGQIRMEKNGEIITINENGLVEYRTEESVTYKIWDSGKVDKFFDAIRNKARDYLENPRDGTNCVWVSLYLDGELVTICFSEDDDVVQEAYEEFEEEGDTTNISYLFDDENEDGDVQDVGGDISDYFEITPTPTPIPTSTSGGSGDTGETQFPTPIPVKASCESWEEQIVGGRAIISNTLCSVTSDED